MYRLGSLCVVKEELSVVPLLDVVDYVEELGLLKVPAEGVGVANPIPIRSYKCRRPIVRNDSIKNEIVENVYCLVEFPFLLLLHGWFYVQEDARLKSSL